jgi:hypothetical protein
MEDGLRVLVQRVNPSDRGLRFVVGASVEWIIAAAAWDAGVLALPQGHGANGFDLRDMSTHARGLWSVKASFSKGKSTFRISNGLGGAGRGLQDDTIFAHPRLPGLVIVCPALHGNVVAEVRPRTDATELPFKALEGHAAEHPECVAPLDMPVNPGTGIEDPSLIFVRELLSSGRFPLLARVFAAAKGATSDLATQITELAALRDEGVLSDEEFTAAKTRLLA